MNANEHYLFIYLLNIYLFLLNPEVTSGFLLALLTGIESWLFLPVEVTHISVCSHPALQCPRILVHGKLDIKPQRALTAQKAN